MSSEMMGLMVRARSAVLLVWNNVTIEPVVMLYLTAYGLNEVRSELHSLWLITATFKSLEMAIKKYKKKSRVPKVTVKRWPLSTIMSVTLILPH